MTVSTPEAGGIVNSEVKSDLTESPKSDEEKEEENAGVIEEKEGQEIREEDDPLVELDLELAEFEHMELSGSQEIFDRKMHPADTKEAPEPGKDEVLPQLNVQNTKGQEDVKQKEKGVEMKNNKKEQEKPKESGRGKEKEREKEKEKEKEKEEREAESDDEEDWVVMDETRGNKKEQSSVLGGLKAQLRKPNACCVSYCKEEVPQSSFYRQQVCYLIIPPSRY